MTAAIRPIRPEDRQRLADGFAKLSAQARYHFFSAVTQLGDRQLDYLTDVDHHDHEALVAVAPDGTLISATRFVRTSPETAEPAIVVADDWQGHGLASALLDQLAVRALDEGITHFDASVLAQNPHAIQVLRRLGETTVTSHGSEAHLAITLHCSEPPRSALRSVRRRVAANALDPVWTFWHRLPNYAACPGDALANDIVLSTGVDGDEPAVAVALQIATLPPPR